jgi:hypothetical protein
MEGATEYAIDLTAYEYDLLARNEIISRTCRRQLESATEDDEGVELSLTLKELEELTGFVAAEDSARSWAKSAIILRCW